MKRSDSKLHLDYQSIYENNKIQQSKTQDNPTKRNCYKSAVRGWHHSWIFPSSLCFYCRSTDWMEKTCHHWQELCSTGHCILNVWITNKIHNLQHTTCFTQDKNCYPSIQCGYGLLDKIWYSFITFETLFYEPLKPVVWFKCYLYTQFTWKQPTCQLQLLQVCFGQFPARCLLAPNLSLAPLKLCSPCLYW